MALKVLSILNKTSITVLGVHGEGLVAVIPLVALAIYVIGKMVG